MSIAAILMFANTAWRFVRNPFVIAIAAIAAFSAWTAYQRHIGAEKVRAHVEELARAENLRQRRAAELARQAAAKKYQDRIRYEERLNALVEEAIRNGAGCGLSPADIERLRRIK